MEGFCLGEEQERKTSISFPKVVLLLEKPLTFSLRASSEPTKNKTDNLGDPIPTNKGSNVVTLSREVSHCLWVLLFCVCSVTVTSGVLHGVSAVCLGPLLGLLSKGAL